MREHKHVHYYAIRRLIYLKLDDLALGAGTGGIVSVLEDWNTAQEMLRKLELEAFRSISLSLLEKLTCDHAGGYWSRCFDLAEYCRREFGIEIAEKQSSSAPYENDRLAPRKDAQLPKEITDEQIWQIKRLSGIDFYEVFEYNGRQSGWEDFLRLLERDLPDPNEQEEEGDAFAYLYR